MQFIGMILQGWLSSILDGAKGFGVDHAVPDHKRDLTLPAMGRSNVRTVVDTIMNLDENKGVWILSSVKNNPDTLEAPTTTRVKVFSYVDDSDQISSTQCKIEQTPQKIE